MNIRLTGLAWTRIGISILLIGLSAFCVLRAVIAGIVYGDIMDLPGRSTQAAEVQHRAHQYLWACLLLQGLTSLILKPVLQPLGGKPYNSLALRESGDYALALGISILCTGLAFFLLFWLLNDCRRLLRPSRLGGSART